MYSSDRPASREGNGTTHGVESLPHRQNYSKDTIYVRIVVVLYINTWSRIYILIVENESVLEAMCLVYVPCGYILNGYCSVVCVYEYIQCWWWLIGCRNEGYGDGPFMR